MQFGIKTRHTVCFRMLVEHIEIGMVESDASIPEHLSVG